MGSSSDFVDGGMFSGQKLPEKTMFTQTCSLLREYLKEKKGPLGELSLGMALGSLDGNAMPESYRPATTPTSNFFPTAEKSTSVVPSWNMAAAAAMATPRNVNKPMNLFYQQPGFGTTDLPKMADHCVNKPATTEPEKAQMTIFYAGQVLVFNDFPANKAKEVMLMASMGSSKNPSTFPSTPVRNANDSVCSIPSSNIVHNMGISIPQERIQKCAQPIDLPIARKASLTRFLEKRKDRINARAPYDMSGPFAAPSKPTESKSWLGLAAQSANAV